MGLLDDARSEDIKPEKEEIDEELFQYSVSIDENFPDVNFSEQFLKQALIDQEIKAHEEYKEKLKQQEKVKNVERFSKSKSSLSLGSSILNEDLPEPIFEDFAESRVKDSFPANVNGRANSYTDRSQEFEMLIGFGIPLLSSQISVLDDYINFISTSSLSSENRVLRIEELEKRKNDSPIALATNLKICLNSINYITNSINLGINEHLINEYDEMLEYLNFYSKSLTIFDNNVKIYYNTLKEKNNER